MMGKDLERIVSEIEAIKDAASAGIVSLSYATAYQLVSREQHAGLGTGPCRPVEIEKPDGDPMAAVSAAMAAMSDDCGKVEQLGETLYTATASFNNGVGSPWGELDKLKKAVANAAAYSGSYCPFNYVGEKAGMLALLNMVMTAAVDTKWAFVVYHDYIQRGYDNKFNDNKPSIDFDVTKDDKSVGNVRQEYEENVNIPKKSVDPF